MKNHTWEDRVGGAAPIVQQLYLLVVQPALRHEVPREDVEDAVALQLDAQEERLAQLRALDVLAGLVHDAQQHARLRRRAVHYGGRDAREGVFPGRVSCVRVARLHRPVVGSKALRVKGEKVGERIFLWMCLGDVQGKRG